MSTKEIAYSLIDKLNESQLKAIIGIIKEFSDIAIEPDEDELKMIAEAEADTDEPETIENFAKRLGINYDSL